MKPNVIVWFYNCSVQAIQSKFSTTRLTKCISSCCAVTKQWRQSVFRIRSIPWMLQGNTKLWDISPLGVHAVLMSLWYAKRGWGCDPSHYQSAGKRPSSCMMADSRLLGLRSSSLSHALGNISTMRQPCHPRPLRHPRRLIRLGESCSNPQHLENNGQKQDEGCWTLSSYVPAAIK